MSEFGVYKEQVLAGYDQKKASGALSHELIHATPGNLKDEWLALFEKDFNEKLLRSFLGQKDDLTAYRMAIKKFGRDKCKPLSKFLNERSIDTEEKNIELLAWLIGFEPRPYMTWLQGRKTGNTSQPKVEDVQEKKLADGQEIEAAPFKEARQDKRETDKEPIKAVEPDQEPINPGENTSVKKQIKPKVKYALILLLILVLGGGATYLLWPKSITQAAKPIAAIPGQEKCMYWAGESYQVISCSQKLGDTVILALDSTRLAHFKKIMQPDTLTGRSVGKVWYVKLNGGIEFYTGSGFHPVYPEKRLRPLTDYMLNKYVHRR